MKTVAIIIVLLIVLSALVACRGQSGKSSNGASQDKSQPATNDVYVGLRNQILQSSRAKIGLPPTADSTQPWGVVMDWGLSSATATVVALSDGSASVYLSNGGGFIGGQGQESINKAAKKTVGVAGEFQPQMRLTTTFPVAKQGEVIFYLLTDSGVFTASAPEGELRDNRQPLAKLANAAQDVITQYRLHQQVK